MEKNINTATTPKGRPSCKARIREELRQTLSALRAMWKAYESGKEGDPVHGSLQDYGLGFTYIAPGTFREQKEPYFCYQLSWGGPSDEFRYYASRERRSWTPYRVEYWFMDWFDGAHLVLEGESLNLMEKIFAWFNETGSTEAEYERSIGD